MEAASFIALILFVCFPKFVGEQFAKIMYHYITKKSDLFVAARSKNG